ncbi:DUF3027 domain-containing protein [Rathayibacter sp. VKM Ac-2857]|uniref:DUF3027 domain-containing protein n=1 Tax=Rathayibacter sp. VKM Ac-2857 TaxID=2739020 RepID=UPI0015671AAD|nr:DUF3027 domain-containing protein [Rathayibacter sp. VKM Ac-2857]NQX15068.1 DUF3027 domain-containing protein [Rathayibacter sp. VKM Ac-2857]
MPDADETTGDLSPRNDAPAPEPEQTAPARGAADDVLFQYGTVEEPAAQDGAVADAPAGDPAGAEQGSTPSNSGAVTVWSDEIDEDDESDDDDADSEAGTAAESGPAADAAEREPEPVYELDVVLAGSEDRAREALLDITTADTIGDLVATLAQGEHVVSLQFTNLMRGYPGWLWTATLSRIDESEDVNVLEVELLPGEGSVLAPDWVPWSVRLADYRAVQDASGERDETEDDEYDDDTVVDGDPEADEDEILDDDDEADDDDVSDDADDEDDSDEADDEDDSDEDDSDEDDDSDDDDADGEVVVADDTTGASADGRRGGSGRGRRRRRR